MNLNTIYPHHQMINLGIAAHQPSKDELILPFAWDDAFMHALNKDELGVQAVLHFWPTAPTVFLGAMDMQAPFIADGLTWLIHSKQLMPILRPAGGLAVVSDPGIINFTLILKSDDKRLMIDDAYAFMVDRMNAIFKSYGEVATTGEVETSYCPGKFDVSMRGKKIAGIAQRRIGKSIGIYVYLSLSGNQMARGELIRQFYQETIKDQPTTVDYPAVDPQSMANLSDFIPELADKTLFCQRLIKSISEGEQTITKDVVLTTEQLKRPIQQMIKRNQRIQKAIS
ncbi:lipoate--protein ligase family protein [Aerococcus suis]|uniref:Lipoate-protein ligase A n=1 Tax=Aerococcus suis TaxID=371602 RepID=A0A1W1YS67_9LACT|nr:hypothetical protein [Aerococcus suis]SMC38984.1 Lipoate-protein ligase A [Aerococcus suis]